MIRLEPKVKSTGLKRTSLKRKPINKVSKKQAKRNKELAKIPPPIDGKCQKCGGIPDWRGLAKHHLLFRSRGGKDNPENLLWLCGKCHSLAHNIHENNT